MENEYNDETMPSYWQSVVIGALTVAVLTSAIGLILQYYLASSEPTLKLMIISGLSLPLTCLLGLVGGIVSTRHYAKTYDITFLVGKGAVIGLFTGILASVFATVIGQLWMLIDPTLLDRFSSNLIAVFEQMEMAAAQKEETIQTMRENYDNMKTVGGIFKAMLINAGVLGLVNLISGMIGAKIFASEE